MTTWIFDTTAFLHRALHVVYRDLVAEVPADHTQFLKHASVMVSGLLDRLQVENVVFALDSSVPSIRVKEWPAYKEGRKEYPPVLAAGAPKFYEGLRAAGFCVVGWDGYEADDVVATLVYAQGSSDHRPTMIVSSDKDLLQLVTPSGNVALYDPTKDRIMRSDECVEKMGVEPRFVPDLIALTGDTSDNIPGVPSVGPKTALKLIEAWGTIEDIYRHETLFETVVSKRIAGLLRENRERAFLSKSLALPRIFPDVTWQMFPCRSPGARSLRDVASYW